MAEDHFTPETAEEYYQLGMRHIYGDGVTEDNIEAARLLTLAAEQGHVEAAYNLGICYHYGFGVEIDLPKALDLYRFSADRGYAKGKHLVGRFYFNGWVVEQDYREAIRWFEASDALNDPSSCGFASCYLGVCSLRGLGMEADAAKARALFEKAAAQGGEDAEKLTARLIAETGNR